MRFQRRWKCQSCGKPLPNGVLLDCVTCNQMLEEAQLFAGLRKECLARLDAIGSYHSAADVVADYGPLRDFVERLALIR